MTDAERTEVRQIVREEFGHAMGLTTPMIEVWKRQPDEAIRALGFAQMHTIALHASRNVFREMMMPPGVGGRALMAEEPCYVMSDTVGAVTG